jgi:flagellar biosynthesis protein FliR
MSFGEPEIGAFIAVFLRAVGLAVTAPVIGDGDVPMRARLVFVFAIAIGVGASREGVPMSALTYVGMLELAVGLLTGLTARFVMARIAVAGQLIGLSLGLGFAAQFDPKAGESAGTLRALVTAIAGLAFLAAGGLEEIVRSAAAGPARVDHFMLLGPALIEHGTAAFGHGLTLAAPIVLAALVGNVGFALMNRAAPAANVFSIALAGVLIIGGLVMLATAGGFIGGITEIAKDATDILTP